MPRTNIVESHPTEFFRGLVREAIVERGVAAGEETEFYLVTLLEGLLHGAGDLLERPVALTYLEAESSDPHESFQRYKQVGDTGLVVAGLFVECLERASVQPSYYVQLGQLAFQRIAANARDRLGPMFDEMAQQYGELVGVLGAIGSRELFSSDRDTLRIYRRWLASHAQADARELYRRGIIPGEPSRFAH